MRRRNPGEDEERRGLERRAASGDEEAALELERLRAGERRYFPPPVYHPVETPFGRLAIKFEGPTKLMIGNVFPGGLTEDLKAPGGGALYPGIPGSHGRRQIHFSGHVDYFWQPATGRFEPAFFADEAVEEMGLLHRRRHSRFHADGGLDYAPPTLAYERRVVATLAGVVNDWIAAHPEAVDQAALAALNNRIIRETRELEGLLEKLADARAGLAGDVAGEIEVRSSGYHLERGPAVCALCGEEAETDFGGQPVCERDFHRLSSPARREDEDDDEEDDGD